MSLSAAEPWLPCVPVSGVGARRPPAWLLSPQVLPQRLGCFGAVPRGDSLGGKATYFYFLFTFLCGCLDFPEQEHFGIDIFS